MRKLLRAPVLLIILAIPTLSACETQPLLAPTDSTIMVVASQAVVPLHGESVITASVTEAPGTPVPNGTLVTFSTTLGSFDVQEARTRDGRASVRLLAGGQAGTATITAFSGAATSAPLSIMIGNQTPSPPAP